jgi:iron complex transport system ATP-binding protein
MIRLEKAGFRRGDRWIFRSLDLHLERGRCMAVLGPNGRGKTSLIKTIAGLLDLSEGTRKTPSSIGYVSQAFASALSYRCIDMVVMGRGAAMGAFGTPSRQDYAAAEEALDMVGALAHAQRAFDRLSGGERQLVMLARALATGSQLLVLDEPASALDLANQSLLLSVLLQLKYNGRHTILFSTHSPQHALHVADDVFLMLDELQSMSGNTDAALSGANLQRLYGIPVERITADTAAFGPREFIVPIFEQEPI